MNGGLDSSAFITTGKVRNGTDGGRAAVVPVLVDSGSFADMTDVATCNAVNALPYAVQPTSMVTMTGDRATLNRRADLRVEVGGRELDISPLVLDRAAAPVVLGMPTLSRHNPRVDFAARTVDFCQARVAGGAVLAGGVGFKEGSGDGGTGHRARQREGTGPRARQREDVGARARQREDVETQTWQRGETDIRTQQHGETATTGGTRNNTESRGSERDAGEGASREVKEDASEGATREVERDAGEGATREVKKDAGGGATHEVKEDAGEGATRGVEEDAGEGAAREDEEGADERAAWDDGGADRTTDEEWRAEEYYWVACAAVAGGEADGGKEKPLVELPPELAEYADRFDPELAKRLPPLRPGYDMLIELTTDSRRVGFQQPRKLSQVQAEALQQLVKDGLERGIIYETTSEIASAPTFAKKKDGTIRGCMDYRRLNKFTRRVAFPSQDPIRMIDRLRRAHRFTVVDLTAAYWQVRMAPESEALTTFTTEDATYAWRVMPFGLVNAPAVFQRFINAVLRPFQAFAGGYFDDLIIFSARGEDHWDHVRQVLQALRDNQLCLSLQKCKFNCDTVAYLGMVVGPDGVSLDPDKVKAVAEWPVPTDIDQVRQFLGLTAFMRRHVGFFAHHAKPLTELTRKGVRFAWSEACQAAFEKIKRELMSAPVLAYPQPDRPYHIFTDASDVALGGVLMQSHVDDQGVDRLRVVAYYSRVLSKAERMYTVYARELLAIVTCLTTWWHYTDGTGTITVWSDHRNLVWFTEKRTLNLREAGWAETLGEFDFFIKHIEGAQNQAADALSRAAAGGRAHDLPSRSLIDPRRMVNPGPAERWVGLPTRIAAPAVAASEPREEEEEDDANEEAFVADPNPSFTPQELEEMAVRPDFDPSKLMQWLKYEQQHDLESEAEDLCGRAGWVRGGDGLVRQGHRIYVPPSVRNRILWMKHDMPAAGHRGQRTTRKLVALHFVWPGMYRDIDQYVASCPVCQLTKAPRHAPYGFLKPIEPPSRPGADWSIDFVTGLGDADGAVMVCTDRLTRLVRFIHTSKSVTAKQTAHLFLKNIVRAHGVPQRILSDRGPQFISRVWHAVWEGLGTKISHSSAYHAASNGLVERVNQPLETYLRLFCERDEDWRDFLWLAEFSYNSAYHTAIKCSPFKAMYGFEPCIDIIPPGQASIPAATERLQQLKQVQQACRAAIMEANEIYRKFYNTGRREQPELKVGQLVTVLRRNMVGDRTKLDPLRVGPFKIVKQINELAYELDLAYTTNKSRTFHVSLLEPFDVDGPPDRIRRPMRGVATAEGERSAVIEKIIDSALQEDVLFYRVHWRDTLAHQDTWERAEDVRSVAPVKVSWFHISHPESPKAPPA